MAILSRVDDPNRGSFLDTLEVTDFNNQSAANRQIDRSELRELCKELKCAITPIRKPVGPSEVGADKILELFDEINFDDKSEWAIDYVDPRKITIEGQKDCVNRESARENLGRLIDSLKKNIMMPGASTNGQERRAEYDKVLELLGHLCATLSKLPTNLVYKKESQGKISRIPLSGLTIEMEQIAAVKQRNQTILSIVSCCTSSFGLIALKASQAVLKEFDGCKKQIEGKLIDLRYEILRDQASYKNLINECGKQGIDPLLLFLQHLAPRGLHYPFDRKIEAPFMTAETALKNFDEMYTSENIVEAVKSWIDRREVDIESVVEWFNSNAPQGFNQEKVLKENFELIEDSQYIRIEAVVYMLKKMGILV